MGQHGDGFSASAASIDGSSHLLVEIAGLLYQGRMDGENATLCRVPRSHPDVAQAVEKLARFGKDQYEDTTLLLAALSTKLRSAAHGYADTDHAAQQSMNSILEEGRFVAPESR